MSSFLHRQAMFSNEKSLAHRFRSRRMRVFERVFGGLFGEELEADPRRVIRILDIGGTYEFWESLRFRYLDRCDITLLNLEKRGDPEKLPNVRYVFGDALDVSAYGDGEFDLAFSNSCIEHVGRFPEWRRMADGMRRVGKYYFLQTPNRYFPMETHFMVPFFHFYPRKLKACLFQHFNLSYFQKSADWETCVKEVDGIHLLSLRDLKRLFPGAQAEKEKLLGLTKSLMIHSPIPYRNTKA